MRKFKNTNERRREKKKKKNPDGLGALMSDRWDLLTTMTTENVYHIRNIECQRIHLNVADSFP